MNRTDAPSKQSKPFGINGQREPLLATTPAGDNTASYDQGFPPITMILKSAGGLPPKGQDMNQILFELSALARWSSAGALNTYDSTFATAITGYPSGAVLISDDGLNIYINTTDGNTSNPNTGGAGWKTLLEYLNLSYGAPAIGIPFFWPSASMPNTVVPEWSNMVFLKNNGASFSGTEYPKLALMYPGLTLPDTRGEFIRAWDDGRGVDSGRALLSAQSSAAPEISGSLDSSVRRSSDGALIGTFGNPAGSFAGVGSTIPAVFITNTDATLQRYVSVDIKASRSSSVYQAVTEVRPRNIAFNFLVRAK